MLEIDRALARAYGPGSSPNANPTADPDGRAPAGNAPHGLHPPVSGPHFAFETESLAVSLRWPATVLSLERDHGHRFERLARHLGEIREKHQLRVLLFTSCHRAEGRTTLVLTLARALARRPGRTLIVDADLGGPMLASQLGLNPRYGLREVVEDGLPPSLAILDAPADRLAVLPLRTAVSRPRDFLASPGWALLMARLRREFDLVLLDGSPLFTGLSAAVLHRPVDAAILVHNHSVTGQRALLRAQEVLDAGGIPLLGLAETFV